jgi:hypothetical protein
MSSHCVIYVGWPGRESATDVEKFDAGYDEQNWLHIWAIDETRGSVSLHDTSKRSDRNGGIDERMSNLMASLRDSIIGRLYDMRIGARSRTERVVGYRRHDY